VEVTSLQSKGFGAIRYFVIEYQADINTIREPQVMCTGMKIEYKKELNLSFGDYVEAYEKTDNTSAARISACIVLFPSINAARSWTL
jgi:hypothetical protein